MTFTSTTNLFLIKLQHLFLFISYLKAKRTPFGAFGGKLKHLTATDLAVHSSKAAIQAANVSIYNIPPITEKNFTVLVYMFTDKWFTA